VGGHTHGLRVVQLALKRKPLLIIESIVGLHRASSFDAPTLNISISQIDYIRSLDQLGISAELLAMQRRYGEGALIR
jgi:hypothetical protein